MDNSGYSRHGKLKIQNTGAMVWLAWLAELAGLSVCNRFNGLAERILETRMLLEASHPRLEKREKKLWQI